MSEDALTWNVFVGLARARKLQAAAKVLTGRDVDSEPTLYLWGRPINVENPDPGAGIFPPLNHVRDLLERDIGNFKTEPDAMLVVPGSLVVCIEAKFGSGNTLAHDPPDSLIKPGDKPVDRKGLLARYLDSDETSTETKRVIERNQILSAKEFHSQLFRNIVFASAMAAGEAWHVVNLVSETQRRNGNKSANCSFDNPEVDVQSYLHEESRKCFTFRTWEGLFDAIVKGDSNRAELNDYLLTKSAHYLPAFKLT